jgi:hypothetical protein
MRTYRHFCADLVKYLSERRVIPTDAEKMVQRLTDLAVITIRCDQYKSLAPRYIVS